MNNYLEYLHKCYAADNRELTVTDFLNKRKVEHGLVLEQKEALINDEAPKLAIDPEKGRELMMHTALFAKERELMYGSLFLLGEHKSINRTVKVCAPLLLFHAIMEEKEGDFFISINANNYQINTGAIELLCQNSESDQSAFDIIQDFPEFPFNYGGVGQVSRHLKRYFPELNVEDLLLFPELWPEKKIKRKLQPKQRKSIKSFKLIPASMVGSVQKSNSTFGIISELKQLEKSKQFSEPLRALFKSESFVRVKNNSKPHLPAVLNASQNHALLNARNETLSLIVGPPGTGKSFTIAAIAIDHLLKDKSVLICSKQDEAVDVVGEKLTALTGSEKNYLRGGRAGNLRKATKKLNEILHYKKAFNERAYLEDLHKRNMIKAKLAETEAKLDKAIAREIGWAEKALSTKFFDRIETRLIGVINKFYHPHWQLLEDINRQSEKLIEQSKSVITQSHERTTQNLARSKRAALQKMYQGLRANVSSERDSIFKTLDYSTLLRAFPVWLSNLAELYRILPQEKELFDLVIIDEASQCDIATSLAAMQRAKRVVICGDPNQLRHVSFVSGKEITAFANEYNIPKEEQASLNFRKNSILDFVSAKINSQSQVSFLEEHYRSVPAIIDFPNKAFYSNSLAIMKTRPNGNPTEGVFEVKLDGTRESNGENQTEATYIMNQVERLIQNQQVLPLDLKSSIGLLSPFSAQCNLLRKMVSESLNLEMISNHRISVGTAYSFQGEERDVMFLSMAVDDQSHHSAFVHLNKPDVFNVSITRARTQQYIVHSIDTNGLQTNHYLRMYLDSVRERKQEVKPTPVDMDNFMTDLVDFINVRKLEYWLYFSVAGTPIDILVKTKNGMRGIDLIGYAGQFEEALNTNRLKLLGRSGIKVFPLPYSYWKYEQEKCKTALKEFLGG